MIRNGPGNLEFVKMNANLPGIVPFLNWLNKQIHGNETDKLPRIMLRITS